MKVRRCLQNSAHLGAIKTPIGLGPRRLDGRPARAIQKAKLDSGPVDDPAHDAAKSIDLADDMAFGDAAYRRITGHLADQIEIDCDERGFTAQARRGRRRLAAGVSGTDHDHIKRLVEHLLKKKSAGESADRKRNLDCILDAAVCQWHYAYQRPGGR